MMIMTAILTKEQILSPTIYCRNAILAIAALVISHFEFLFIRCCKRDFIFDNVLTWAAKEIIKLKDIFFALRLNEDGIALSDIRIVGNANFPKVNFANEESDDFMLLIEEFLYIDMPTFEDYILQRQCFVDEFI